MEHQDCEYLMHYGVKGMRWGVRKDKKNSSSGTQKTSTKKKSSEVTVGDMVKSVKAYAQNKKLKSQMKKATKQAIKDAKEEVKAEKRRKVSDLSNEELKNKIDRLEMEKKYKNLRREQVNEGSKLAQNILKKAGENIGTQLATYALGTAVNKLLKDEIVNPKKGQRDK